MTVREKQHVLSEHLERFRTWSDAGLTAAMARARREHGCLECFEGTAADGTQWTVEINVVWDDKPQGNVRVIGDLTTEPQRPIMPFIPIYPSDVVDSFNMRPDGTFVDE